MRADLERNSNSDCSDIGLYGKFTPCFCNINNMNVTVFKQKMHYWKRNNFMLTIIYMRGKVS